MGLLQLPGVMFWAYCRGIGLCLVITYGLCMKAWRAMKPSLKPILDILHAIDPDDVSIVSITEQFVRTLLMVWVLLWKVIQTLWHTVPKPILQLVNRALQFLQDLDDEFGVTGKPRSVVFSKKVTIRSPETIRETESGHSVHQEHGRGDGEDQGVELD